MFATATCVACHQPLTLPRCTPMQFLIHLHVAHLYTPYTWVGGTRSHSHSHSHSHARTRVCVKGIRLAHQLARCMQLLVEYASISPTYPVKRSSICWTLLQRHQCKTAALSIPLCFFLSFYSLLSSVGDFVETCFFGCFFFFFFWKSPVRVRACVCVC